MSKITLSARNEECQIRIPDVCNFNPETTVFAHLNGGGTGMKNSDIHGSYACSSCHDVVDHRVSSRIPNSDITEWFYDGMVRTQLILLEKGLIKIS